MRKGEGNPFMGRRRDLQELHVLLRLDSSGLLDEPTLRDQELRGNHRKGKDGLYCNNTIFLAIVVLDVVMV
jgi:hypothetical protein